jgi:hypothetical protein
MRTMFRLASAMAGILLMIPGFWAIFGLSQMHVAPPANPWFDWTAGVVVTAAIWIASFGLLWFAAKPRK